ncbi:nucleotidyltransferase family protein [Paenibacillus sp. y28]|uniref:nucleotidyltransferase family protein n=1 Tax=Paenibacillus sp. y28 TaxID=3129110 RepID=UPI00301842E1
MRACGSMTVHPHTTIQQAMQIIEQDAAQIAIVTAPSQRLLGTVTDGDVRRAILKGVKLHEPVQQIMNTNPTSIPQGASREAVLQLMIRHGLRRIPVLDDDGRVVGIEALEDLLQVPRQDNWVVIMAGGLGSRLAPLTNDCPKPLLTVGNKPILETILQSLAAYSFTNFFFSVHYKAEMIENYFGDGSKWGVRIQYLREQQQLGTAGALTLLPSVPDKPLIVINGDLLTSLNFPQLLQFHLETGSAATMCIREYTYSIPYGLVRTDQHRFLGMQEKPIQKSYVNAGIYVMNPHVLSRLPANTRTDMPQLFQRLTDLKLPVSVFPVQEYWLDIGQPEDYERANRDYDEVFP